MEGGKAREKGLERPAPLRRQEEPTQTVPKDAEKEEEVQAPRYKNQRRKENYKIKQLIKEAEADAQVEQSAKGQGKGKSKKGKKGKHHQGGKGVVRLLPASLAAQGHDQARPHNYWKGAKQSAARGGARRWGQAPWKQR